MNISFLNRMATVNPETDGDTPQDQRALTGLRSLGVTLYTASARITGELASTHWRVSDCMNALNQDFLLVHDATVQQLQTAGAAAVSAAEVLVRLDEVLLAAPKETSAGVERNPARQGLQVERVPTPVRIEAWPFTVEGAFQLSPGVDLHQHVHGSHRRFLPVADARIVYHPSPLLGGPAPFLLVNRLKLQVVLAAESIGRERAKDPDVPVAPVAEAPISSIRAAEVLQASRLFEQAPIGQLEAVCLELLQAGVMSHRLLQAGTPVFEQGDSGDTLYVVEKGHLEVTQAAQPGGPGRSIGYLGPGEVFGEMAVLGDGRRSAKVASVTDASLLAISERGVAVLLKRCPGATRKLMTLIMQRSTSLPADRMLAAIAV